MGKNLPGTGNQNTLDVVAPSTTKLVADLSPPSLATVKHTILPPIIETGSINKTIPLSQAPSSHIVDPKHAFTLHVRTFERSKEFGAPLNSKGDDRMASTSTKETVTSRINYKSNIDSHANRFVGHEAISDPSELLMNKAGFGIGSNSAIANRKDKADPIYHTHADGKGSYNFNTSAADPILAKLPVVGSLTPDINIKGHMRITEESGC